MKYLSDYTAEAHTGLFDQIGVIFAFSNEQFREQAKPEVKYNMVCSGMFCPAGLEQDLLEGLARVRRDGVAQDVAENGIEAIVIRELGNYECWYTGDPADAIRNLRDYPVTPAEIWRIFTENWPED